MDYIKQQLKNKQRREAIKALFATKTPVKRIATKYGITHQRVYQIINGK